MTTALPLPLRNVRVLSLALNLPGPAALMRCARMGADCTKLEPPPAPGHPSADPMGIYSPAAYATLHSGVRVVHAHLKTAEGQAALHEELTRTDVLITSFRPSALTKLGLSWEALQAKYPRLSLVRIVGAAAERAEEPGHDLTYLADAGLVTGTEMPPTLYADMGGALMASEAVLQALLERAHTGSGACIEVALADAAAWLAQPRDWGLTTPEGDVGGNHAGYRIYPCADGRVAVSDYINNKVRVVTPASGNVSTLAGTGAMAVVDGIIVVVVVITFLDVVEDERKLILSLLKVILMGMINW